MDFVTPYYIGFTVFALYTYDFVLPEEPMVMIVVLVDYILSGVITFLLLLFFIFSTDRYSHLKIYKMIILSIMCIGITMTIEYIVVITPMWIFGSYNMSKMYVTRGILMLIQIGLALRFPIKFPTPPITEPVGSEASLVEPLLPNLPSYESIVKIESQI